MIKMENVSFTVIIVARVQLSRSFSSKEVVIKTDTGK
jgi:hypothetical protein